MPFESAARPGSMKNIEQGRDNQLIGNKYRVHKKREGK